TVPARSDIRVSIDASARESSTEVEYFGGWIGAGWLLVARGDDTGMAAEPCLPSLSRTWIVPDGTTAQGEDAWTVVMNPTAAVAVFAAQLLVEGHSVTTTELSDIVLPPHRS